MSDLAERFHDAPLDSDLTAALAAHGLTAARVDDADREQVDRWLGVLGRGFLDGEPSDARREAFFDRTAYRRKIGVYDTSSPRPDDPVATFASWDAELTIPGGRVPACAISSVTVSPTHRRRGILRALMTGELRTAAAQGFAVAALTVSESTIYGRFGFGPAAAAADWELSVRRARWIGRHAPGRVDFIDRDTGRVVAERLHDHARATRPGELDMPGGHWDRSFGLGLDADKPELSRVVQYASPTGEVEGVALYTVTENHDDATESVLDLKVLVTATDDAYAGLWEFFLSMDLIGTVRAAGLALDEPLWWMIADQRAAKITIRDHHYLRILDVPAALSARRYDVADAVFLDVADPLEIAGGAFVLTTDVDGAGFVEVVDEAPLGIPSVRLGVVELSAMLLGGVSAVTLARAGRIETDDAERVARLLQTVAAPQLSFEY